MMDFLTMWLVFPFASAACGFFIGMYVPIVGPKTRFRQGEIPEREEYKAALKAVLSSSVIWPVVLYILTLSKPIESGALLVSVAFFYGGQYLSTTIFLWNKKFCRLCHSKSEGAEWGVCLECLEGIVKIHGGRIEWGASPYQLSNLRLES